MEEFLKLRKRLLDALNKASEEYPGKSYEGEMAISYHYPGIYDFVEEGKENEPDCVAIVADFYLIGPHRHYTWEGRTLEEAVKQASENIDTWIAGWKEGDGN